MIRLNLISGPRNISTALMYSFAQRKDTHVLDEPFYACYLVRSQADHPGKKEVLESQPQREEDVLESIFGPWPTPVLFIKNMAHHIEVMDDRSFLEDVTNIFLIRNPHQIIASYAQVIHSPVMRDIGIEYQYQLFHMLQERGQNPLVVDSGLLLEDPASVLRQLCERAGIVFSTDMLHWQPGPKPYDGVWATHWYANVHQSTGFEKQPTSNRQLPRHLQSLCDKANNYYEKLLPFSLKP
jgi:hypothetical protein